MTFWGSSEVRNRSTWLTAGRAVSVISVTAVLLATTSLVAQKRKAPTKIKSGTCLDAECHQALAKRAKVHRPVKKKQCDACHEMDDEEVHKFAFPDTSAEMCYGCHDSVTEKKKFVHFPVKKKKFPCTSCHDPHAGAGKGLLKAKTAAELCLECHDTPKKEGLYHQSAKAKGCAGCHEPHASNSAKLLRTDPPKLCNSCHTDVAKAIATGAVVHGPVASGCTGCHDPHNALAGKGLQKPSPAVCTTCHAHFAKTLSAMAERHPLLLKDKGCRRCHEPHAAANKGMLRDKPRQLCLSCHDKEIKGSGGRVIESLSIIAKNGDKDLHLHGPLASGECSGCHEPHGNHEPRFLLKAYPGTFYSPYSSKAYSLCFSCHKAALAEEKATTSATKFRNGKQNLHFVHVNKARKGRTCGACHSPHVSKSRHFLRESISFGAWKLPIGFVETKTGGSCASGCHRKFAYDREKPVNMKRMPPKPSGPTRIKKARRPATAPATAPATVPVRLKAPPSPAATPSRPSPKDRAK